MGVGLGNEENERSRLQGEAWFHGSISRQQAESLLKQVCIDSILYLSITDLHRHYLFHINLK